jgi:hypothetical protein
MDRSPRPVGGPEPLAWGHSKLAWLWASDLQLVLQLNAVSKGLARPDQSLQTPFVPSFAGSLQLCCS